MSEYALVSEVYGWPGNKKKKKRRVKENREFIKPLSPNEMDKELLNDSEKTVFNEENEPGLKLRNMSVSPYTDNDTEYQSISRDDYNLLNENVMNTENQNTMQGPRMNPTRTHLDRFNDPEYEEFLEFKRRKQRNQQKETEEQRPIQRMIPDSMKTIIDPSDQFNELLLYIFTGFFLLMIYDNIYKLGKDSY